MALLDLPGLKGLFEIRNAEVRNVEVRDDEVRNKEEHGVRYER